MLHLYNSEVSGNCYKVRLMLSHLDRSYETTEIDVLDKDPRPEGLGRDNPLGKVPMLVLEDGRCLAESNAILWHLAQGTRYVPDDPDQLTEMLRWMFFEQNVHETSIAVNRFLIAFARVEQRLADVIRFNRRRGNDALDAMEAHLSVQDFFAAGRYSIADIALYGYTHVAEEGKFDLESRPAIRDWLARVREQPGHVAMRSASTA